MRVRYVIAIFATSVAVQVGPAFGQTLTKNTEYMVDASIRKLLRQMDRDKNGTVSKDEFLRHFSERFDRLDVNHDRRLCPTSFDRCSFQMQKGKTLRPSYSIASDDIHAAIVLPQFSKSGSMPQAGCAEQFWG